MFYADWEHWSADLKEELEATAAIRDAFAGVLGARIPGRRDDLIALTDVDILMVQLKELTSAGERYEDGLAQFIAEQGYMPMFGMPTRVRSLYLGLRKKGAADVEWDTVDRDLDLAIFEFAPSQVLVRDKQRHRAIGFTGTLRPPFLLRKDTIKPSDQWYEAGHYIARCETCEGTTVHPDKPEAVTICEDCDSDLQADAFRKFYVPYSFRTSFKPIENTDDERVDPIRRSVVAEIKKVEVAIVEGTNLTIHAGGGATVLRLNEGPIEADTGTAVGYAAKHVKQLSVKLPKGTGTYWPDIENQFITSDSTTKFPRDWVDGDQGTEIDIKLVSRKPTDALYLGLNTIPPGLGVDRFGRGRYESSVRAAAISATYSTSSASRWRCHSCADTTLGMLTMCATSMLVDADRASGRAIRRESRLAQAWHFPQQPSRLWGTHHPVAKTIHPLVRAEMRTREVPTRPRAPDHPPWRRSPGRRTATPPEPPPLPPSPPSHRPTGPRSSWSSGRQRRGGP